MKVWVELVVSSTGFSTRQLLGMLTTIALGIKRKSPYGAIQSCFVKKLSGHIKKPNTLIHRLATGAVVPPWRW